MFSHTVGALVFSSSHLSLIVVLILPHFSEAPATRSFHLSWMLVFIFSHTTGALVLSAFHFPQQQFLYYPRSLPLDFEAFPPRLMLVFMFSHTIGALVLSASHLSEISFFMFSQVVGALTLVLPNAEIFHL